MSAEQLIITLFIGLIAGWLAGKVVRGKGFGLVGDMIIGVVGALLGNFLFGLFRISLGGGIAASLIAAFVGAVILVWILRMLKKR